MKIGVTGASGMLGTALISHLSSIHKIYATSRSKGLEGQNIQWNCFDLTNTIHLEHWIKTTKPDVIIHCAAIVNVEACEDRIDLAEKLHVETTRVIARCLDSTKGRLIYISTDSVFNGKKKSPYNELEVTEPLNNYAKTKLLGERLVLSMQKGLVLRTNIIGWTKKGKTSFAEWVLNCLMDDMPLNLFYDVYFSPLHVDEVSLIIEKTLIHPIFGLYHCSSNDMVSKFDFGVKMAEIFELSDLNINKIGVESIKFKAGRPKNMALSSVKLESKLNFMSSSFVYSIELMKAQYDKNSERLN
jgi:dTDP-4-dehydrorhamnose reductase